MITTATTTENITGQLIDGDLVIQQRHDAAIMLRGTGDRARYLIVRLGRSTPRGLLEVTEELSSPYRSLLSVATMFDRWAEK